MPDDVIQVIRFVTFSPCILTAAQYDAIKRDVVARYTVGDIQPGDRVLARLLYDHAIRRSEIA